MSPARWAFRPLNWGYFLIRSDLPLRPRVAAIIVLLYAQPLSRVARLTIDDVIHDGDQVLLRLGDRHPRHHRPRRLGPAGAGHRRRRPAGVTADAGYGDNTTFRLELERRDWQYVVAVRGTTSAYAGDARPVTRPPSSKTVFTTVSTRRSRPTPELLGFRDHYRFR